MLQHLPITGRAACRSTAARQSVRRAFPAACARPCASTTKPTASKRRKSRTPAKEEMQNAANQRRGYGAARHDKAHQRQFLAGPRTAIEIAHHRSCENGRTRRTERLQARARRSGHRSMATESRSERRRNNIQARSRGRTAGHTESEIGPVGNLADGKADEIGRQRQLNMRGRHAEAHGRYPAKPARYRSVDNGPNAVSAASSAVNANVLGLNMKLS